MFTHVCGICGEEFQSASNRAKYCVYCRDKAQVLRNKVETKQACRKVKKGTKSQTIRKGGHKW